MIPSSEKEPESNTVFRSTNSPQERNAFLRGIFLRVDFTLTWPSLSKGTSKGIRRDISTARFQGLDCGSANINGGTIKNVLGAKGDNLMVSSISKWPRAKYESSHVTVNIFTFLVAHDNELFILLSFAL
jgi:hypothetical protein